MTTPMTPDKNLPDRKQLAKDVASELAFRQRRKKLLVLALVAALVIAAILFLQFGSGWGLGGKGKGTGAGSGSMRGIAAVADAGPARCAVRVTAEGITVDGAKATRDETVARCKETDGAMVTVTGDARQGDWDELRAALQAVGVKIYIRGQLWDGKDAEGSGSGSAP